MGGIGSVVLTACIAGIVSTIVSALSPNGSEKAVLRLMISMIVIICLLRPLTGIEPEDILGAIEGLKSSGPGETLSSELESYDIKAAELSVKLELEKFLKSRGISFSSVVIKCERDEYDLIAIKSAEVTVPAQADYDKLSDLSETELNNTPLIIKLEENYEGQ